MIAYASPQLDAAGTPEVVRRDLQRLVSQAAGGQLPALARARNRLALTPAWHAEARSGRRLCLSYLDLRRDVLRRGSADADVLRTPHPELDRARQLAFPAG